MTEGEAMPLVTVRRPNNKKNLRAGVIWMRLLLILSSLLVLFALSGCGGGSDAPFVVAGNAGGAAVVNTGKVENASLLDLYNSISVGYTTRSSAETPQVFNTDVVYGVNGFTSPQPSLFQQNSVRILAYDFPANSTGIGNMTVVTNQIAFPNVTTTVDIMTEPEGSIALYGIDASKINTPVIGIQAKGIPAGTGTLVANDFAGKWGYVSMSVAGSAVIAELNFNAAVNPQVQGIGFQSTTSGTVSGNLLPSTTSTFSINPNRDKLVFLNGPWFVNPKVNLAMSGQGFGVGADRLSFLLRPLPASQVQNQISGKFELFQWTVFSPNSRSVASAGKATSISGVSNSEVFSRGSIEFTSGTAIMQNVLGLAPQNHPYQLFPGTEYMWYIPFLEQNLGEKSRLRFFLSADKKTLFGIDYANDTDGRTAMFVGLKTSPQ